VFAESEDDEQIIERVAALDIGKAEVVCCVRLPAPAGKTRRVQEVTTHSTMVGSLSELANRLVELRVERVVMEATSDYWRPPFYLFEAHGLQPWLVNAKDVKHLPGRPKTDVLDAVWLCKVAERQMLRPSFVPPHEIRRLRDLTRYRADLVGVRTAEKNRVEKLLELSRSGARCPDCSRPFPQTARRTRRAPLDATGSPRKPAVMWQTAPTGSQCSLGSGIG
jgi:transposase